MLDYYKKPFKIGDVEEMLEAGNAVKGNDGGLLLGKSHELGGIKFLVRRNGGYILEGEVDGYEYILNPGATHYFAKNFDYFNNYEKHKIQNFGEYIIPESITTLNCNNRTSVKYLVFDFGGFSIVNKHSTKGYLTTLEEMNRSVTYEVINPNELKTVNNHLKSIEIYFYNQYEGYLPPLKKN